VLDHLAPAARSRGISLGLVAGDVPPVSADAPGFDDAVLNLVRNALEAVGNGGKVLLRIEAAADDFVRVRVDDDGPGVPVELREALIRPGVSSRDGTDRGLGLSRVADWLALRGAVLDVEDATPEGGASIGFVLPVARETPPARRGEGSGGVRVLLVEDDVAVAEVLSLLLASDGHEVVHCADADTAIARFAPGAFDLALCDQNLPDGTGEGLARLLRSRDPELGCFLVTGAPESVNSPDDPRCGVLAKPVSRDDLRGAVARVVRSVNPGTPRGEA
jgi:CheY-like chemotaxis protein